MIQHTQRRRKYARRNVDVTAYCASLLLHLVFPSLFLSPLLTLFATLVLLCAHDG